MRVLYLSDTHIRGTTPRGRRDDLAQALLAKLHEVVSLARDQGVAAILHGGDLFDRPDVAPAVARDFLHVLKAAPCPIYGIAGNHDLFGFNPDTVPRAMIGLFDGFGLVRLLRPGQSVWLEEGGLRVQVSGQEFHAELDRRDPVQDYCVLPEGEAGSLHQRSPDADFALHLTHGMLLERPFLEGAAHTLLGSVMERTAADVTFGAHYHPGWGQVHAAGKKRFVSPGALVRLGTQRADSTRKVSVALVELERGQAPRCIMVPLQSARPAGDVLDVLAAESLMERERALADFLQGVGLAGRFEVMEVQAIMERIAEQGSIPARVRAEALDRLGRAQESLSRGEEEPA